MAKIDNHTATKLLAQLRLAEINSASLSHLRAWASYYHHDLDTRGAQPQELRQIVILSETINHTLLPKFFPGNAINPDDIAEELDQLLGGQP